MSRPLLASALATLALTACVDNNADSSLVLLRNLAPGTGCALMPDSTDYRSSGVIQSDSGQGYLLTPVVRNDLLVADGEAITPKTVFVEGAHVTISFFDDRLFSAAEQAEFTADGLTRFAVPTAGAVDPGGGTSTFGIEVVPAELLALIDAKLLAVPTNDPTPSTVLDVGVQIYGAQSGSTVESNLFHYPVEVCTDCIRIDRGRCDALPSTFVGGSGGACVPLQDGILDCCVTSMGATLCPAVPETPPET